MNLIRLVVFGFLGLSALYLMISIYSRSVRREKLENRWDAKPPEDATPEAREAYVREGMKAYQNGIRPKLILLVYVVPTIAITIILLLTNWN